MKALKQFGKDAMVLTATGIGLGVGASAISDAGGDASVVSALAKGMKPMGSIVAGGAVLGSLSELSKKIKVKY